MKTWCGRALKEVAVESKLTFKVAVDVEVTLEDGMSPGVALEKLTLLNSDYGMDALALVALQQGFPRVRARSILNAQEVRQELGTTPEVRVLADLIRNEFADADDIRILRGMIPEGVLRDKRMYLGGDGVQVVGTLGKSAATVEVVFANPKAEWGASVLTLPLTVTVRRWQDMDELENHSDECPLRGRDDEDEGDDYYYDGDCNCEAGVEHEESMTITKADLCGTLEETQAKYRDLIELAIWRGGDEDVDDGEAA